MQIEMSVGASLSGRASFSSSIHSPVPTVYPMVAMRVTTRGTPSSTTPAAAAVVELDVDEEDDEAESTVEASVLLVVAAVVVVTAASLWLSPPFNVDGR